MKKRIKTTLLTLIFFLMPILLYAQFDNDSIAVFHIEKVSLSKKGGIFVISYQIKDKIHLYVASKISNPIKITFPNKDIKIIKTEYDKIYQDEEDKLLKGNGKITIYFKGLLPLSGKISISYQGCSDEGMCFIPENIDLKYNVKSYKKVELPKINKPRKRLDKKIADLLKNNIKNPLFAILLVFLAGFLTSLTPCIYPMIPITISYFGRRNEGQTMKNAFFESILYVLGLSITYTVLGIIAALTGSAFGSLTQNSYVLILFSALFFLMAFMMCEYLPLPGISLAANAQSKVMQKRSFFQPFLLGLITGLVASPCVGPVVLFLLTLIITSGNIFYGALLMLFFGLGLGVIFIVIGTFSSLINKLPKAGSWMEYVNITFAILMTIVAGYFLNIALKGFNVIGASLISLGLVIMFISFFLGLLSEKPFKETDPFKKKKYQMFLFLLIILFLIGFAFMLKGFLKENPKYNLTVVETTQSKLKWSSNLDDAIDVARQENKLIFVDFRADWCAVCKEFEKACETDEKLQKILSNYVLVRLDYEKNKSLAKNKYHVLGLPTFLILNKEGQLLHREAGFANLKSFVDDLSQITKEVVDNK